ncbi:MAG: hypothetical protein PF694_02915 [Bacteroidetes bacterium]|jgi:hypothetical protein|nr:hypothetical protein [Bacteroidota bacterium]
MMHNDILTYPKDLNVYRNVDFGLNPTLKGSNVCRTDIACFHTTPVGSNNLSVEFFYKHQIPSGLFADIKSENMEQEIQSGLKELKPLIK